MGSSRPGQRAPPLAGEAAGQPLSAAGPELTETRTDPGETAAGLGDLAGDSLPQRVRQASLAPQLRTTAAGRSAGSEHALRDPETARAVMSAFHRGWQDGLTAPGMTADPAAGPTAEGGPDE